MPSGSPARLHLNQRLPSTTPTKKDISPPVSAASMRYDVIPVAMNDASRVSYARPRVLPRLLPLMPRRGRMVLGGLHGMILI